MIISDAADFGLRFQHFQSERAKWAQWEYRLPPLLSWLGIARRAAVLVAIAAWTYWLVAP